MAGVGDNIDQRGLVVLLSDGGVVHALGHQHTGVGGAQAQAHGQTDAFADDGALQEDGVAGMGNVTGDDDVGDILSTGIAVACVGQTGHLSKDTAAVFIDKGMNASHSYLQKMVMIIYLS